MNSEKLENLFLKAIDLPPGPVQDRFVEEQTAGDPLLRRELEQLLIYHADSGDFLETPLLVRDPSLSSLTKISQQVVTSETSELEEVELNNLLGPRTESAPLGQLGHFQLLEILGQGGSAVVYRARDAKLTRDVAIKILLPSRARSTSARDNFLNEARAIAAIRHPNVVSIYDVGEQQGISYIVMEYLPAGSLQARIDSIGRLSVPECLLVAQQVTAALEIAHATGLQHRDVKPSNILIDRWPESVKLGDFGLAIHRDDPSSTSRGGTLQYASPEQLRGEAVDERTDLFGLGCTIYAMLCGQSPFSSASRLQAMNLTLTSTPPSLTSQGKEIPPRLERLVFRLLEKDRANRPSSAREVAEELSAIRQGGGGLTRRALIGTGIGAATLLSLGSYRWLGGGDGSPQKLRPGQRYYFYLQDERLKFHLHHVDQAVCVFGEGRPGPTAKPLSYWRPAEPGRWGSVIYRFAFAQAIGICRLFASCYCSFGLDPCAKLRLSFSADGSNWALAVSLAREQSEQFFHNDEAVIRLFPAHEKETVITQDVCFIHAGYSETQKGVNPNVLVWPDTGPAEQLFVRAEFYAERELFADDGSSLGPAAAQFLRYRPEYQNGPLFIDYDAAKS